MAKTRRRGFGTIEERPSKATGAMRYRAFYTGPDGKRHRAPTVYDSTGEAEAFLRAVLRDIRDGMWTERSGWPALDTTAALPASPLLTDWLESCIVERETRQARPIRAGTPRNYRKLACVLAEPFGALRVNELTAPLVSAWHAGAARATPTQTANAYLLLRSVMDDAVEAGLASENPCQVKGANGKPEPRHRAEAVSLSLTSGGACRCTGYRVLADAEKHADRDAERLRDGQGCREVARLASAGHEMLHAPVGDAPGLSAQVGSPGDRVRRGEPLVPHERQ